MARRKLDEHATVLGRVQNKNKRLQGQGSPKIGTIVINSEFGPWFWQRAIDDLENSMLVVAVCWPQPGVLKELFEF